MVFSIVIKGGTVRTHWEAGEQFRPVGDELLPAYC
jgi:hypothetical protein